MAVGISFCRLVEEDKLNIDCHVPHVSYVNNDASMALGCKKIKALGQGL